jgi:hypothetical protein
LTDGDERRRRTMRTENERLAHEGYVVTRTRPESEIRPEDLGLAPEHEVTATVVTFRDGRVVAIQNHRTREDAMRG